MVRRVLLVLLLGGLAMHAKRAYAVTMDEISPALKSRLPDIVWRLATPEALSHLTLADIAEYAGAYEAGELLFINETHVAGHSGFVTPEQAMQLLQVPPGAPFVKARFLRLAREAYGRGVFSELSWAVKPNDDGSIDLELSYSSRAHAGWKPNGSHNRLAGWIGELTYYDYYYGGKDRQLTATVGSNQNYPDDFKATFGYSDNTLNGGRRAFSVSGGVYNQWRRRLEFTPAEADLRDRITYLSGRLGTRHSSRLGLSSESLSLGAGVYSQDHFVFRGDPTVGGTAPRSSVAQAGDSEYAGLYYERASRDQVFAPCDGYACSAMVERHMGDFDFTRAALDCRAYIPAANVLGVQAKCADWDGGMNRAKELFPAACFAVELQAGAEYGDVPYSHELRADKSDVMRSLVGDRYLGTKKLGLRAEYRFALDAKRKREAYVFSDNALIGESVATLQSVNTVGLGAIMQLPLLGGLKAGGWYGWSLDGNDRGFTFAVGYAF
jgi:hypothetical protein